MNLQNFGETCERIGREVSRVLVGQDAITRQVLTAILARGHVLIEGVPGLGKALLVRTRSRACSAATQCASSSRPI